MEPDRKSFFLLRASRAASSAVQYFRKTPSRRYRICCNVESEAPAYLIDLLQEEIEQRLWQFEAVWRIATLVFEDGLLMPRR